jgi:membrane-bound serine protease (ClpP class)
MQLLMRSSGQRFNVRAALYAALLAMFLLAAWLPAAAQGSRVYVLTLNGPLTPAQAAYLQRAIQQAQGPESELIILQLNTPGGDIGLMQNMVASIRGSQVPVVVFVAPRGALAGSAGTIVTLAGDAAAMAPETVIGAASPVGSQGQNLDTTEQTKLKEALKAEARTLAAQRPPAAIALAQNAIETAQAATASEAKASGLVDFLASDVPDLLRQMDGYRITVNGQAHTLHTSRLEVVPLDMNLLESVLDLLTNPNVVFLLLTIGAQALLIELSNPGGWIPGVIGAVSLALAFYGLGVLPVNWFGLIFIGLAFVLFVLEVHAPTHGALAATGTASLVAGALVLFNSPGSPDFFRVSVPLVVITALLIALAFVTLLTFALRAQRRPVVLGMESLIGREGEMRTGQSVQLAGEVWTAAPADGDAARLEPGQRVVVTAVQGLKVLVRPKKA